MDTTRRLRYTLGFCRGCSASDCMGENGGPGVRFKAGSQMCPGLFKACPDHK